ncbi:hypothetical protein AB4Y90_00390 [Chryseobacterium sp. 2TAF14]|uniref:hypothetical protein n=1 Tax=Chryseobacterium sp. 2TAF14 TaxID=3233007 RepID=UPI003F8DC69E
MSTAAHMLVPMTDFVIEYYSHEGYADLHTLKVMNNYAKFLKTPLSLEMFVPTDHLGNILKEPKNYSDWKSLSHNKMLDGNDSPSMLDEYKYYSRAENKCLFDGFRVVYNGFSVIRIVAAYNEVIELSFNKVDGKFQHYTTIESLLGFDAVFLSTTALKKIGLKV